MNQKVNMVFVAVIPSLILLFAPFILRPTAFLGDEPHYLIVANSILKHHTLNLKEAYMKSEGGDDDAGKVLKGQPVDHHTVFLDTSTFPPKKVGGGDYTTSEYRKWHLMLSRYDYPETLKEYSMRPIGWPVLIALLARTFSIGAEMSALLLSHIAVVGIGIFVFLILIFLHVETYNALIAQMAVTIGSQYLLFSNTAFADAMQGLLVAGSIYALLKKKGLLLGGIIAFGIWVKLQFLILGFGLGCIGLILLPNRQRILLSSICMASGIGMLVFYFLVYGSPIPPTETWTNQECNPWKAFKYFTFDIKTSIAIRNPWLIPSLLLSVGLCFKPSVYRANRRIYCRLLVIILVLFVPILFFGGYDEGYDYPCRHIMPIIIPFSVLLGLILQECGLLSRITIFLTIIISISLNLVVAFSDPRLTYQHDWQFMKRLSEVFSS